VILRTFAFASWLAAASCAVAATADGPQPPRAPRASSAAPFPGGEAWGPEAYRRALRQLIALSVAGKPLPRLRAGVGDEAFSRLMAPVVTESARTRTREGQLAALLEVAWNLEKARSVYVYRLQTDRSYGPELGALVSASAAVAVEVARRVPAREGAVRARALQVIADALVNLITITQEPNQTPAVVEAVAKLVATRVPPMLAALPPAARREAAVRLGLAQRDALPSGIPAPLVPVYTKVRDAGQVQLRPPLDTLMARGMPAPERAWSVEDLARALEVARAADRKALPRWDDPVTGPLVRRMVSADHLRWLDEDDVPTADRIVLASRLSKLILEMRSIYSPAIQLLARGGKMFHAELEMIEIAGLEMRLMARASVLEESFARSLPPADAATPFRKLALAGGQYLRPKLIAAHVALLAPVNAPPRPAKLHLLESMREALPMLWPRLDAGSRTLIVDELRALEKGAAEAIAREIARVLAAIER
jgi:hypothetical protein